MTQDIKTAKLQAFRNLIILFSHDEVFNNEIKNFIFRGDIAYFVDKYYDTDEWDYLNTAIQGLIKHSLYSDIFFLIASKSELKYIENLSEINSEESLQIKKEHMSISQLDYLISRQMDSYCSIISVGHDYYPDWFLNYEHNLKILTNFNKENDYI